jgi:acyl-CoA thioester hydrolase
MIDSRSAACPSVGPPILCKRLVATLAQAAKRDGWPLPEGGLGMRIEIPEHKKLVYEMDMSIRWGDMDAMGHLNNTSYFRYFETIRIDWFNSLGQVPGPAKEGVVIVNAFCNFYRQVEYPGTVRLKMYASDPARTTFETWVTMERIDLPGVIHAAGGATTMWVDFPKQKSMPLPDWLRAIVTP